MKNKELNSSINFPEKWEPWTGSNRCPHCGGAEIEYNTGLVLTSYPPQSQLRCKHCGHIFSSGIESAKISPDELNKLFEHDQSILGTPYIGDPPPGIIPQIGDWPFAPTPNEPNHIAPSPNYGWICPKCGRCLAPHVDSCPHCSEPTTINITY